MKLCSRVAWIVIAFAVTAWWFLKPQPVTVVHGTVLEHPRAAPLFNLTGMDGRVFNNQSLHGHWTMLFFGFTHCDSVCPVRLMELAKMIKLLQQQPHALPHVVMVSLDPERDAGPRLTSYVQAFNPNFYAATGSKNTLRRLQHAWGISSDTVMRRNAADGTIFREIEHASTVMVFNPAGSLVAFLTGPELADQLASDFFNISTTRNK